MAAVPSGVWGIDVGQCGVKAIRLESVDDELTATAFDYVEYPKILTQPDADPDQLIHEALDQFLSRNSIRGDLVVISVPGQSGLVRFVKLPPVEEKKIADIVRFEAKQQIPFPLDEVVWDFQKLGAGEVNDGFAMGTEIGLFAIKRDTVFRYLQHFKDVGVEVQVVQMAPLALYNFVSYDLIGEDPEEEEAGPKKKKCVVALDIGTDNSNLVITDGDRIIWQRPIPLGGNHFTRALTKDMKLTFAKAEHLKKNAVKSPDLRKILASLKTVLNDFVGEVQRSLGYFTNTHRDAKVEYMIGLGNAFRLPGLQKYLQEKLQLEVRKLTQLARVEGEDVVTAPTFVENLPSFAVCYGLALQGLKKTRLTTNLLPYEVHMERLVRGKKPWAVTAGACLLLVLGGMIFAAGIDKASIDGPDVQSAMQEIDAVIKQRDDLKQQYDKAIAELEETKRVIKRLAAGVDERWNWQLLYEYINMALPQPDGSRLLDAIGEDSFNPLKVFNTKEAKKAYSLLEKKRFSDSRELDPAKAKQNDEDIKKHLIQVNIESVSARYSQELQNYYKKLAPDPNQRIYGMRDEEKQRLIAALNGQESGFPRAGWVIEIRGYTYHGAATRFVTNTFVENLRRFGEGKVLIKKIDRPEEGKPDTNTANKGRKVTYYKFGNSKKTQEFTLNLGSGLRITQRKLNEKTRKFENVPLEGGLSHKIKIKVKGDGGQVKDKEIYYFSKPSIMAQLIVDDDSKKEEDQQVTEIVLEDDEPFQPQPFQDDAAEMLLTPMEMIADRVELRTSVMMVYQIKEVDNPRPSVFELIGTSNFEALGLEGGGLRRAAPPPPPDKLGPPGKGPATPLPAGPVIKDRALWRPLLREGGQAAPPPPAATGESGESTIRRTEFVVLFVWQEPFLESEKEYGPPPGAHGGPPGVPGKK